jgi:hypothetical protein
MRNKINPIDIESKIQANKNKFDFISLLRLLNHIGYTNSRIRFKSHNSLVSQTGLIRKIQFKKKTEKVVVITLNLGLLGPQSPLPSYFQKMIDTGIIDVTQFFQFINFFDHPLIENFLQYVIPERNTKLFPNWEKMKLNYIKMLDLKSVGTVYWFLSLYFPELELRVDKISNKRQITTTPFILGTAILGDTSTFGDRTLIHTEGIKVTFFAEEELNNRNIPWPKEIKKRLRVSVFPIFSLAGMDIQVMLVIKFQNTWARLQPNSYLGYDKIRGGINQLRVIKIYNGYLAG